MRSYLFCLRASARANRASLADDQDVETLIARARELEAQANTRSRAASATNSCLHRVKAYGPEDTRERHVASANWASLYAAMGEYSKAEPLYQRALQIREKALGPEHADTAASLNNLGELYYQLGNYAKAEDFLRRVLEIREKVPRPRTSRHGNQPERLGRALQRDGGLCESGAAIPTCSKNSGETVWFGRCRPPHIASIT